MLSRLVWVLPGRKPWRQVFSWRGSNVMRVFSFLSCPLTWQVVQCRFEPRHDKPNKVSVRPAKTQISLGIRPVWSESLLCTQWVAKDPSFLHGDSKDSDQTGRMPRLIRVFAGCTAILLVLSCCGSFIKIGIIMCGLTKSKRASDEKRKTSAEVRFDHVWIALHFIYMSYSWPYYNNGVTLQDSQPLKGGRGHASMVLKCKLCARENSIGKAVWACLF